MSGQGGAATGALIGRRPGAVLVVGMQPAHHGLWMAAGAHRYLCGAGALGNVVKGQETLAATGMSGVKGHRTQVRLRLAPAGMLNSQHYVGQSSSVETPCKWGSIAATPTTQTIGLKVDVV
jgi:hypothetical protein